MGLEPLKPRFRIFPQLLGQMGTKSNEVNSCKHHDGA
jgi:hypothetical protein